MKSPQTFTRRGPDRVAEELAAVLTTQPSFEFKPLFLMVHANLRSRNAASGGEEMLRLRTYERLQTFVQSGLVKRTGKEYRGDAPALEAYLATTADVNAQFAAAKARRKTVAENAAAN
jgi:hypothetical protein